MASKRTSKTRRAARRPIQLEPPQGPDEYITLENEIARQKLPKQFAETPNRVTLHVPGGDFDPSRITRSREVPGTWEIDLPQGAGVGVPGRNYGRMAPAAVRRGIKRTADTEAFRPAWLDYTPHPKMATERRPTLRRINGEPLEPAYGVFGPDDRVVYYPSGYPWTCIGKVYAYPNWPAGPAWSGSGVLVGNRVLLTAGHVAPWGSRPWAMRFVPASWDGSSTQGMGITSWVSDYWGYNTNSQVSAWDMVVCRLYTPLGARLGYYGAKTYSSSWQGGNYWTLAGYPGAVAGGNRPSRQMWFPVNDDDSDGSALEIEYTADISPGNSGGPTFGFWGGDPYVIGTVSGGSMTTFLWWTLEDTNVSAGGSALVDLIRWARSNWP